jgi:hypothetical protein
MNFANAIRPKMKRHSTTNMTKLFVGVGRLSGTLAVGSIGPIVAWNSALALTRLAHACLDTLSRNGKLRQRWRLSWSIGSPGPPNYGTAFDARGRSPEARSGSLSNVRRRSRGSLPWLHLMARLRDGHHRFLQKRKTVMVVTGSASDWGISPTHDGSIPQKAICFQWRERWLMHC